MARERDHYLPAMHLRAFSADGRRLWQLDRRTRAITFVSVRDAGIERHLNTILQKDAVDRSLETYMARTNESAAAPILRRLRDLPTSRVALSAAEDDALARYITLTYVRSPANRGRTKRNAAEVARRMARTFEDSAAFAQNMYARGARMDATKLEVFRLKTLVELREGRLPDGVAPWLISVDSALDKPPPLVASMTKVAVRRDGPPWMLLGDSAILLMHEEDYTGQGALGFGVPGVRVVVPLSPDAMLICASLPNAEVPEAIARWSRDEYAAFVNRASVDHASRFLFAREREHIERMFLIVGADLLAPA